MNPYSLLTKENTRLPKPFITGTEDLHKVYILQQKIDHSNRLIRETLLKGIKEYGEGLKVVVSCSFGVDSIVTLFLVLDVAKTLNIKVDVVWNNTLNEYPETRLFAKRLTEEWSLRLIEATPKKTIRKIYEENGVDSLLKRKGDRSKNADTGKGEKPVVEKCCGTLKHEPMRRAIKEHGWHIMFNGVRAGESRQRWMSSRRDGEYYYSKAEWKTWVVRPIIYWTSLSDTFNYGNNKQEDIWDFVRAFDLPYNPIYDKNAVLDERYTGNDVIVKREEAERLIAEGYNVFMPRTGCQACPIPIKRGYLQYLRQVYPKVYRSMLFKLGFAEVLIREMEPEQREQLYHELNTFGIIDENTEEEIIRRLEDIIEWKPCVFDSVGVEKKKNKGGRS